MVHNDEVDIGRWSHYDEYLKSNTNNKARKKHPGPDALIEKSIKSGDIESAMYLRDQLATVSGFCPRTQEIRGR